MTQFEYERLSGNLAKALRTQRRFIKLVRSVPLSDGSVAHSVNLRGFYYRVVLRGDEVIEVSRELNSYEVYG